MGARYDQQNVGIAVVRICSTFDWIGVVDACLPPGRGLNYLVLSNYSALQEVVMGGITCFLRGMIEIMTFSSP